MIQENEVGSDNPNEKYMYTLQSFDTLNIVDLLLIVLKKQT